MSKRYIDADALVDLLRELAEMDYQAGHTYHGSMKEYLIKFVDGQLPADVAEVRHACWSWETGEKRCTNCGVKCPEDEYNYLHPQYCPNCGAKMDGERREENEK